MKRGVDPLKLGIVDYKAGNSQSVAAAAEAISAPYEMVRNAQDLDTVDAIVLPGVGSAGATMQSLQDLDIICALDAFVNESKRPYLGICVGLQILFDTSEEDNATCLGWLRGTVKRFDQEAVRVPQIGWNKVDKSCDHPIFRGIDEDCYAYFVNSYHAFPDDSSVVVGAVDYNGPSTAIISRDNIWATQFHIEKSGPIGLRMLRNFAREARPC